MNCSMPNFLVLHYLPEFAQNHVYWASDAIQPSHTLSPVLFPSIFSGISFSNESAICIRWSKYWSFIISPSNEYLGWISFMIDLFDLFAVQGTLKSLLQHNSSEASILQCSAWLQHSILCDQTLTSTHDYWKNHSFDSKTLTFVSKAMFLCFNMLLRFVIAFLPRSKHLLISWLQLQSAAILVSRK